MDKKNASFRSRLHCFRYACNGIVTLLKDERNARIHAAATLLAVGMGIFFGISSGEWIAVVLAVGMVFAAEALNTAVEYLADFVSPGKQELIGKAKDVAAGAVLIAAVCALALGLIIFVPKILDMAGAA